MPNLKVYVESTVWAEHKTALVAALAPIRSMLCKELAVEVPACQLALIPTWGLDDQPLVSAEIFVLPRPERTRERLEEVCRDLRDLLSQAGGGARTAVRCNGLDPHAYFALK